MGIVKILSAIFLALFFAGSCSLAPSHLQTQQAGDLAQRRIKRVAVLGVDSVPDSERKIPANEISAAFDRFLYRALAEFQDWQVVSEKEAAEASAVFRSAPRNREQARKLGEMVHADAVLFGQVLYFRERVGEELGAKSPASVTFVLELLDVRRGDVAWKTRFEESQRALSENLFALGTFAERGARWLKAEELAQDGIKKAVRDLHRNLFP